MTRTHHRHVRPSTRQAPVDGLAVDDQHPVIATISVITESVFPIQIQVAPNETAGHLARRLGVYHPSALCRWPMRVRLLPGETVYELTKTIPSDRPSA